MASLEDIKELRLATGASMSDCKEALEESDGNLAKAMGLLKSKGLAKAAKKLGREVGPGIIEAYVHSGSQVGVIVEVRCETDFVARNSEFKNLAHELCLQIASMHPLWIAPEDISEKILAEEKKHFKEELSRQGKNGQVLNQALEGKLQAYFAEVCLLNQPYIKDPNQTIENLISSTIAKVGENIRVKSFCRLAIWLLILYRKFS